MRVGRWVCSEMLCCLCLARYPWYQRDSILASNTVWEIILCAASSSDKQQGGMVAPALPQHGASVLVSLSGSQGQPGLTLAASHQAAGFPALRHGSAMLVLASIPTVAC